MKETKSFNKSITPTSTAQMAQNLFNSTIQQMITDSLLGNTPSTMSGSNTVNATGNNHITTTNSSELKNGINFPNSTATNLNTTSVNPSLVVLKQNLLNAKIPYDIISSIPLAKVKFQKKSLF